MEGGEVGGLGRVRSILSPLRAKAVRRIAEVGLGNQAPKVEVFADLRDANRAMDVGRCSTTLFAFW